LPGITLHFIMADRVLEAWRDGRSAAPFDLDDPSAHNAFYHGAVGPDLGYFPGGARCLSDLAHCLRTGVLSRTLVHTARSARERAFAWGWITHVLADQAIHPWIGRGVGELVHGDRERFVDGSSDILSHLRVEMGVDAWYAARSPAVRRRRLRPAFRDDELAFLAQAFHTTYGVYFEDELFRRSHRAASRRVGQALATLTLVHALMDEGRGPALLPGVGRTLRALYRIGALRNVTMAYLTPVRPAPWLLEVVQGEMARHTVRFMETFERGAGNLDDWNLDTGRTLEEQGPHPGTQRARAALAARAPRALGVPAFPNAREPALPEAVHLPSEA